MQIKIWIGTLIMFAMVCCTSSCGEEGSKADSYFRATVTGTSWNGSVNLVSTFSMPTAQALISDSGDPAIGDILFISYGEAFGQAVSITIPAEKRVTELTDDHEVFGMGLGDPNAGQDGVGLISETMSLDLKVLKKGNPGVFSFEIPTRIEGAFTGIMNYTYIDTSGNEVVEPHLVDGEFKFFQ